MIKHREIRMSLIFTVVVVMWIASIVAVITLKVDTEKIYSKTDSTLTQIEKSYLKGYKGIDVIVKSDSDSYTKTEKGEAKSFIIRDRKTNEILASYLPVDKNGDSVSKVSKILTLDKGQDSLTNPKYKEVAVENYYNINKTIKEYNSKYTDTVLSYEKTHTLHNGIKMSIAMTIFIFITIILLGVLMREKYFFSALDGFCMIIDKIKNIFKRV